MLDHLLGGKEDPIAGSRPLICGAVAGGELGWDTGGRDSLAVAIAQQSRGSEKAGCLLGLWKRMVGGWRY